ncbi:hypothetical protein CFOL_v3_10631 [Cephalotus follicularis]|uniref:Plastid division protein PDV2 n=1 Tax=Cephalotus follicularis TaxID=3775 RepID=A0A1Q3BGZ0_CEPFO|nr:hypothetical protein CFOL_v3_10631 [Cephalotus follicularis]
MEMEEEGIGVVLAKATELRLKITDCIHNGNATTPSPKENQNQKQQQEETVSNGGEVNEVEKEVEEDDDDCEEDERLLNIRDAFESLESQLASLQDLQQKQRYEKEVALAEIDYSRKMLLEKLKEYKGEALEVIQEASAFAGEKVQHHSDLLLPPYLFHTPHALDNGYLSQFRATSKSVQNGVGSTNEGKKNLTESERNERQIESRNSRRGLGHLISLAAKTVFPLVGMIYILSLSDFGPHFRKGNNPFKVWGMFQEPATGEKKSAIQCPPGKVLVVEDGEARCLVKERIEIPFASAIAKPDIHYGCG